MTIDHKDYLQNIADARGAGYADGRRAALEEHRELRDAARAYVERYYLGEPHTEARQRGLADALLRLRALLDSARAT